MSGSEALLAEAQAYFQAGALDHAARLYRDVLTAAPDQPEALHKLGLIAQRQGKTELALQLIERALAVKPDQPKAALHRAVILRSLRRNDAALQATGQALALKHDDAEAWALAGLLLAETQQLAQAQTAFTQALALAPHNAAFHADYAYGLLANRELVAAYRQMQRALALDPNILPLTMANILKNAGYPERALPYFQAARRMLPANHDLNAAEAMAHLQIGDFAEGWRLWLQRPDLAPELSQLPFWQGEAVEHLLVYEDQGIGDALQFIRYLPQAGTLAQRVTLRMPEPLQDLCAHHFPALTVINFADPVLPAAARIALSSLPALFGTVLPTLPANVPYLTVAEGWRVPWRERLGALKTPRIGLVWSGNTAFHENYKRSFAFQALQPLLDLAGANCIALQCGTGSLPAENPPIMNAAPQLTSFAATAGLLAELDLLITVDTAVAHLGGALGLPVWTLLGFDADWRWWLGREDSPWYPTMRLFRQTVPGEWPSVIARVAGELRRLLAGDRSVLQVPAPGPLLRQDPHALSLGEA